MDRNENLIFRWDDAPHHKNLKTFPYHVHFANGVKESEPVQLIDVLHQVENIVIDSLVKNPK